MPRALPTVNLVFGRSARFGKRTVEISIADATNVSESSTNAALVPNDPATNRPKAAPSVSITDQVTEAIALAGTSSRSETIEVNAAVFAGKKNVENTSCKTVTT